MSALSIELISWLGLLVVVAVVASPRLYPGLTNSAPETEPARLDDKPGVTPGTPSSR